MGKFDKVIESLRSFDLSSVAGDKVVVCLAVIGLASTVKVASSYFLKSSETKQPNPPKQTSLKSHYDGQWALITDLSDEKSQHIAQTLANEGYNLIVIDYSSTDVLKKMDLKGVQVKQIDLDSQKLATLQNIEEAERVINELTEDVAVIVSNIKYSQSKVQEPVFISGSATKMQAEEEQQTLPYNTLLEMINQNVSSQILLFKLWVPYLSRRYDATGKKGAIINLSNLSFEHQQRLDVHAAAFSATKAFQYTFGMGMMTEDIEKKLDILLAVEKEDKEIIQGVSPVTHEV